MIVKFAMDEQLFVGQGKPVKRLAFGTLFFLFQDAVNLINIGKMVRALGAAPDE